MSGKTIQQVLRENTASLLALPGVVGAALGERSKKPCIIVMAAQETPSLLELIPRKLDGFVVELVPGAMGFLGRSSCGRVCVDQSQA